MQLFLIAVKLFALTPCPNHFFLQGFYAPHTTEIQPPISAAKRRDYAALLTTCQPLYFNYFLKLENICRISDRAAFTWRPDFASNMTPVLQRDAHYIKGFESLASAFPRMPSFLLSDPRWQRCYGTSVVRIALPLSVSFHMPDLPTP